MKDIGEDINISEYSENQDQSRDNDDINQDNSYNNYNNEDNISNDDNYYYLYVNKNDNDSINNYDHNKNCDDKYYDDINNKINNNNNNNKNDNDDSNKSEKEIVTKKRKLKAKKNKKIDEGRTWGVQTLELCDGTNKKSEKIKITEKNESGIMPKLFGGTDEHLKSTVLPCTDLLVEIKAQGTYLLYSALTKFFTVKIFSFNFFDKFNFFLCYGMKSFLFHCSKFLHFIAYVDAQVY